MSIYTDTVSENIRRFLRRAGMTQAELSNRLGLSRTSVGLYCRGQLLPTIEVLDQIADILGVPTYTLLMPAGDQDTMLLCMDVIAAGLAKDVSRLCDLHADNSETYGAMSWLLTRLTDKNS